MADGVRVAIRLTPKAARNGISGLAGEADGGTLLKVTVTTVPEKGKANAALLKLLAKAWHLPKSDLAVVTGATDRRKCVHIAGDSEVILGKLTGWLQQEGYDVRGKNH
ncbi:DUF167 family protein [Magnetospira thiophila]